MGEKGPWRLSRRQYRRSGRRAGGPRSVQLLARFTTNDRLEVANHRRIGMWAGDSSYAVERIADIGHPVTQRLIHGVLEGAGAGFHRAHLGTEDLHPQYIGLLPFDVDGPHVYDARQSELGAKRGGGNTVHAGTSLGNHAGLAHTQSHHDLTEHIVHFMRTGVI